MKTLKWVALAALFITYSCSLEEEFKKTEDELANAPSGYTSFEDTKIPSTFEFKTSKEVTVNLSVPDYLKNAVFGLNQINQQGDTLNILRGSFNDQGFFSQKITVSQITDKFILNSEYMGLPDDVEIPILGATAQLDVADLFVRNNTSTNSTTGKSNTIGFSQFQNGSFTYLAGYNAWGLPDNLDTPGVITNDFLDKINEALPEQSNLMEEQPELISATTNLEITEEADVWITFIGEGAGYKNALGFYTYTLGQEPQNVNEIDHKIIFANTSLMGSGGVMLPGDRVHLGTFPANTGIGWFIVANGWTGASTGVSQTRQRYYSQKEFNPESTPENRNHMVLLHDEESDLMILGFEDLNRDGNSDNDFNDVLFYTEVNPVNLDLSTIAKLNAKIDTDGDGIIDSLDEYPNNPNFAFTYNAPNGNGPGEIGFEDLWPYRGDDDFNDLVVTYDYDLITNSNNQVTRLIAHYGIKNIGGSLENGFAFTLPISPSLVDNVSGQLLNANYLEVAPNGTEIGTAQNETVIFVVGNASNQEGSNFTITVDFNTPLDIQDLGSVPFNPFVMVQQEREREVHLPNFPPTSKCLYLGEGADAYDPANQVYFKTFRNVPWAIDIFDGFQQVPEGIKIYNVYPRFLFWANSNGVQDQDWYLKPAEWFLNNPN